MKKILIAIAVAYTSVFILLSISTMIMYHPRVSAFMVVCALIIAYNFKRKDIIELIKGD